MQRQRSGNGHPLLLSAGQLVRIVVLPGRQTDIGQQLPPLLPDFLQDALFVLLIIGVLLGQQFLGQRHILQRRILREQIEGLEHHAEMEPFPADVGLPLGGGVIGVKNTIILDVNAAAAGFFQEIETPQQRRFSAARRTDDGHRLSGFQIETDILEDLGFIKVLFQVLYL